MIGRPREDGPGKKRGLQEAFPGVRPRVHRLGERQDKTYQWDGALEPAPPVATVGRSLRDQPTAELGNPFGVKTEDPSLTPKGLPSSAVG